MYRVTSMMRLIWSCGVSTSSTPGTASNRAATPAVSSAFVGRDPERGREARPAVVLSISAGWSLKMRLNSVYASALLRKR